MKYIEILREYHVRNDWKSRVRWSNFNMNELYQVHNTHRRPRIADNIKFIVTNNYPHQRSMRKLLQF